MAWTELKYPAIVDWVKSSHPITVLNPDLYFQVSELSVTVHSGKIWVLVRGENTMGFGL